MEDAIKALGYLVSWGYDVSIEHAGAIDRDRQYANKIKKLIKKLRLEENVVFHGSISNERLLEFFHELDVYLFPNSPQTWGLSVFEAMASGMPVVLTSGCGASEILTDNENAIIIDPVSPLQIAHAIARLIYDEKFNAHLVKNAYDFVLENISWEKYSKSMLTHLEQACQK